MKIHVECRKPDDKECVTLAEITKNKRQRTMLDNNASLEERTSSISELAAHKQIQIFLAFSNDGELVGKE